jgi:steroid 5-alpha reductase family enzyme
LWGPIFIVPTLITLCISGNWNERTILTFSLVSVWGLRLAWHIGSRHGGKEDFRYQDMRTRWTAVSTGYYYWAAFIYVFMMQALFSLIVNSSALFVCIWSTGKFYALDAVGAGIWAFGFAFELIADRQLQAFRDNPANRGTLIKSGLWRYSRHPNYFGEAVLWWGIFIIACSVGLGWITFFAPLFITLLIRFVSGVPLLENKYKNRPEFQHYMKETNVFAPWFVRKVPPMDAQVQLNPNIKAEV